MPPTRNSMNVRTPKILSDMTTPSAPIIIRAAPMILRFSSTPPAIPTTEKIIAPAALT